MDQNDEDNHVRTPTISIPVATALCDTNVASSSMGMGSTNVTTTISTTRVPAPNRSNYYKGFSTSICDLFHSSDPLHKEDCCAFVCCGILARERNAYFRKYLLRTPHDTDTDTTTFSPALFMLILIPILLLLPLLILLRLWAEGVAKNNHEDDMATTIMVLRVVLLLVFVFLLLSCYYRYDQARFRRQLTDPNQLLPTYRSFFFPPQTTTTTTRTIGQDPYEANCAHPICCCGWYTRDDEHDHSDHRSLLLIDDNYYRTNPDLCTLLWKWLSNACCGACLCRCWFQCCGCCAIAQETRQIKLLLPPETTDVDYITHQKYNDYYSKIRRLRTAKKNSLIQHFTHGISKLSQGLILTLTLVILLIYILDLLGKYNQQQPQSTTTIADEASNNYYYTFFPFSHLLVFLATFLQPFLVLLLVHWMWNRLDLSVDAVIKYFASGFLLTTGLAMFIEMLVSTAIQLVLFFLVVVGGNKRLLSLLYLMLNAYISAAFVEELCKYFGFWMVVHPDLCTLTTQQRGRSTETALELSTEETPLMARATTNTLTTFDNLEEPLLVHTTAIATTTSSQIDHYHRGYKSLGCAITIAMISVSLGFACCENLLYVFVYSPQNESITVQLSILGMRSLFPIHPLAAAIQSIGVCKRDLEGDPTVGIGRILLPSVLLHGTFDFSLLLLSWISQSTGEDKNNNEQNITTLALVMSLLCLGVSISVVFIGLCYYYKEARAQRSRLAALDDVMLIPSC